MSQSIETLVDHTIAQAEAWTRGDLDAAESLAAAYRAVAEATAGPRAFDRPESLGRRARLTLLGVVAVADLLSESLRAADAGDEGRRLRVDEVGSTIQEATASLATSTAAALRTKGRRS